MRQCRSPFPELFTVAVHDLSRRRESDAFREAALRAQAALQKAVDDAHGQLEVLESLTDPAVNPVGGPAAIGELLERLRTSVRADGVALVQLGLDAVTRWSREPACGPHGRRPRCRREQWRPTTAAWRWFTTTRPRVVQVSALTWPAKVSSIMVVPVCHIGQAGFRIEVVNERRAHATEWDLALARIVADRLAQAIALQVPADSGNAVA